MEPEVKVTTALKNIILDVLKRNKNEQESEYKELSRYGEDSKQNNSVPFRLALYAFRNRGSEYRKLYLNEILEDSDIVLPELVKPERNPELEARIQKLKRQQENKEYIKMTKNVDKLKFHEPGSIGKELKLLNNQLISVFNFLVTVGGAFAFGYKGTEYAFAGSGGDTFPLQLMAGLILGTIVFFADLYFLVKQELG